MANIVEVGYGDDGDAVIYYFDDETKLEVGFGFEVELRFTGGDLVDYELGPFESVEGSVADFLEDYDGSNGQLASVGLHVNLEGWTLRDADGEAVRSEWVPSDVAPMDSVVVQYSDFYTPDDSVSGTMERMASAVLYRVTG